MNEDELRAIEARANAAKCKYLLDGAEHVASVDVPALLAEVRKLRAALWQFDYNPDGEDRGYFCAGCDMVGDERGDPSLDNWHDDECRAAREALR